MAHVISCNLYAFKGIYYFTYEESVKKKEFDRMRANNKHKWMYNINKHINIRWYRQNNDEGNNEGKNNFIKR